MNPRALDKVHPRSKGTQDFGNWRIGQPITRISQLRVGQVLVSDNKQLDAINLCAVTKLDAALGIAHAKFVDPSDPGILRIGADPSGFSICDFELRSGSACYAMAHRPRSRTPKRAEGKAFVNEIHEYLLRSRRLRFLRGPQKSGKPRYRTVFFKHMASGNINDKINRRSDPNYFTSLDWGGEAIRKSIKRHRRITQPFELVSQV